MANVLVTGGSGFIGGHLVRVLLARGDNVTCLVRKTSRTDYVRRLGVEFAYGDVADSESLSAAVAGKSVVYHLAGATAALRRDELYRINAEGPKNVAEQCARQADPPVLVIASSLAVAGASPDGRMRVESDPPAPVSHYGRSKLMGETAVRPYAERVPMTIVRPSIVFGEADHYCLPLFRTVYRLGLHVAPSFSKRRFSLVHADDLATLLVLAAERGQRLATNSSADEPYDSSGIYFAADRERPTYHRLGRMIGEALGRASTRVISTGPLVVWTAAAVSELAGQIRRRPSFFGIDKAREARAGHWVCSPRKAIDQLGFSAAKPLGQRFRETAEWYLREGWL
jgi:nucleoside-diphosphate-sugar epimerase